ncbi:hypothetical protein ACFLUJ_09525 [Chloroflexota bacterium]
MIRTRWVPVILAILLLGNTLVLSSCKRVEPEGSVIEKSAEWLEEETLEEFTRLRITATVMNIGDDGVIGVSARITVNPNEGKIRPPAYDSTTLYLRQGEEQTLHFDFWASGAINWDVFAFTPSE